MRAIVRERWTGDFLSETLTPETVRVTPRLWLVGWRIDGLYFERSRSVSTVLSYARSVGIGETLRKIKSREAESARNEKHIGLGIGTLADVSSSTRAELVTGAYVAFVAPLHPKAADDIVVHASLVDPIAAEDLVGLTDSPGRGVKVESLDVALLGKRFRDRLLAIAGWSPYSGADIPTLPTDRGLADEIVAIAKLHAGGKRDAGSAEGSSSDAKDRSIGTMLPPVAAPRDATRVARLFGLGNYAKTIIIPSCSRGLEVRHIHEIDPMQIGTNPGRSIGWSTSPAPPEGELDEHEIAWFVAGYHHTHGPIAAEGVRRNLAVVSEKPVVTSRDQLAELLSAVRESRGGRFFSGFQRRYSAFSRQVIEDLDLASGVSSDPITYSAVVFEVPLPGKHWYRWPNSGTKILSNACHWIDHFHWLNGFAEPVEFSVRDARSGGTTVLIDLENGSSCNIFLTHTGSARIGMRDTIEMRRRDATVRITDSAVYESEATGKRIRKMTRKRLGDHREMYRTITKRILDGSPGEPPDEIASAAGLVLSLDELAAERR